MIKALENVFFPFRFFFVQLVVVVVPLNNPLKCYLNINRLFFSIKLIVGWYGGGGRLQRISCEKFP